jgi:hypothetical protein
VGTHSSSTRCWYPAFHFWMYSIFCAQNLPVKFCACPSILCASKFRHVFHNLIYLLRTLAIKILLKLCFLRAFYFFPCFRSILCSHEFFYCKSHLPYTESHILGDEMVELEFITFRTHVTPISTQMNIMRIQTNLLRMKAGTRYVPIFYQRQFLTIT